MAGGIIQLVANTGASQNVWLESNPEITFFKRVYRRHTPFATETIPVKLSGDINSGSFGSSGGTVIPHLGDLVHRIFFVADIPPLAAAFTNSKTQDLIKLITSNHLTDTSLEQLLKSNADAETVNLANILKTIHEYHQKYSKEIDANLEILQILNQTNVESNTSTDLFEMLSQKISSVVPSHHLARQLAVDILQTDNEGLDSILITQESPTEYLLTQIKQKLTPDIKLVTFSDTNSLSENDFLDVVDTWNAIIGVVKSLSKTVPIVTAKTNTKSSATITDPNFKMLFTTSMVSHPYTDITHDYLSPLEGIHSTDNRNQYLSLVEQASDYLHASINRSMDHLFETRFDVLFGDSTGFYFNGSHEPTDIYGYTHHTGKKVFNSNVWYFYFFKYLDLLNEDDFVDYVVNNIKYLSKTASQFLRYLMTLVKINTEYYMYEMSYLANNLYNARSSATDLSASMKDYTPTHFSTSDKIITYIMHRNHWAHITEIFEYIDRLITETDLNDVIDILDIASVFQDASTLSKTETQFVRDILQGLYHGIHQHFLKSYDEMVFENPISVRSSLIPELIPFTDDFLKRILTKTALAQMEFYFIAEMIGIREQQKFYHQLLGDVDYVTANAGELAGDIVKNIRDALLSVPDTDLYYHLPTLHRYSGNSFSKTDFLARCYPNVVARSPHPTPGSPSATSYPYNVNPEYYNHVVKSNIPVDWNSRQRIPNALDNNNEFQKYPIDFYRIRHSVLHHKHPELDDIVSVPLNQSDSDLTDTLLSYNKIRNYTHYGTLDGLFFLRDCYAMQLMFLHKFHDILCEIESSQNNDLQIGAQIQMLVDLIDAGTSFNGVLSGISDFVYQNPKQFPSQSKIIFDVYRDATSFSKFIMRHYIPFFRQHNARIPIKYIREYYDTIFETARQIYARSRICMNNDDWMQDEYIKKLLDVTDVDRHNYYREFVNYANSHKLDPIAIQNPCIDMDTESASTVKQVVEKMRDASVWNRMKPCDTPDKIITNIQQDTIVLRQQESELQKLSDDVCEIVYRNRAAKAAWIKKLGHFLVQNITLKTGDHAQEIHPSDWLEVYNQLSSKDKQGYDRMINNLENLTEFHETPKQSTTIILPLVFHFNRYLQTVLPMVASGMTRHRIDIKLRDLNQVAYKQDFSDWINPVNGQVWIPKLSNVTLMIEYIFLATAEREAFITKHLEYLIDETSNFEVSPVTLPVYQLHTGKKKTYIDAHQLALHPEWRHAIVPESKIVYQNGVNRNGIPYQYPQEKMTGRLDYAQRCELKSNFNHPSKYCIIVAKPLIHTNPHLRNRNTPRNSYFHGEHQWDNYCLESYYDHSQIDVVKSDFLAHSRESLADPDDKTFGFLAIANQVLANTNNISTKQPRFMEYLFGIRDAYLFFDLELCCRPEMVRLMRDLYTLNLDYDLPENDTLLVHEMMRHVMTIIGVGDVANINITNIKSKQDFASAIVSQLKRYFADFSDSLPGLKQAIDDVYGSYNEIQLHALIHEISKTYVYNGRYDMFDILKTFFNFHQVEFGDSVLTRVVTQILHHLNTVPSKTSEYTPINAQPINTPYLDIIYQLVQYEKNESLVERHRNHIPLRVIFEIADVLSQVHTRVFNTNPVDVADYRPLLKPNLKTSPIKSIQPKINGEMILPEECISLWHQTVVPQIYFRNSPKTGVHVQSWALYPLEYQPSGTINFSAIDDFVFVIDFSPDIVDQPVMVNVMTCTINIVRYISGICGYAWKL